MSLDIAIEGLGAPLHRGAIRYYREVGIDIPARLILESDWANGELDALPFASNEAGAARLARARAATAKKKEAQNQGATR
jgi:hypothetical protein